MTYYPGVLDPSGAVPVVVREGLETTANFNVSTTATFKVSGRLINELPNTDALPPSAVILTRRDSNAPIDNSSGPRTALRLPEGTDGQFSFHGVRPGSYDLFVGSRTQDNDFLGRAFVEVRDEDVTSVTVVLRHGVDIKGRLTLDGSMRLSLAPGPLANIVTADATSEGGLGGGGGGTSRGNSVSVRLAPSDGAPNGRYILGPLVNDTGSTFIFPNVPEGKYPVTASSTAMSSTYVADIRAEGKSVLLEGITVGRDSINSLEVVISDSPGALDATIADRRPNSELYALLFPDGPRRANQMYYRVVQVPGGSATGRVTIRGIPPGTYRIFATDQLPPQYRSPEFLGKVEGRALPLTIQRGITTGGVLIPQIAIKP